MDIFEYASKCEANFECFLNSAGKERKTTFYSVLSLAEWCGSEAVVDTYNRVMKEWGDNLEYMCEWVIALNQKIWQQYENNPELGKLYDSLLRKADEYCCEHFKGEELRQYYEYTD